MLYSSYYIALFFLKIFVLELQAYIIDKFNQKSVELKSPKKDPLGKIGKKLIIKYIRHPNWIEFLDKIIIFKFLNIIVNKSDKSIIVPTAPCSGKNSR